MKRNPVTIAVGTLLILVFGSLLFIFQVRKSNVAVVARFGRYDRECGPGAHFRWPWPIETVYMLDQRIQNFEGKFEETKLPDQNILLISTYTGWRIEDPKLFFPRFPGDSAASIALAESTLGELVETAKKEVAGQHNFSDFISADEKEMKFSQIENEILARVQQQVKEHQYGLDVKFVQIKKIGLPESVTADVFERMKSERNVLISKIQNEGEERATKIRSAADTSAAKMLADADAQALQIRGQGEAESVKALQVLQQNPALANFNMKLSALQDMLKERTTLILDQSTPPLDLLQNYSVPTNGSVMNQTKR
jgi:modulator of FtsH protease HflC